MVYTSPSKQEQQKNNQKMDNSKIIRVIVFILTLIIDSIDLASDWLLYHDVVGAKEGLVFGHFENHLIKALFAFSIIGTFLFLFEIITLAINLSQNDTSDLKLLLDLAALLVIWLEDIPQIIINIVIVACRDQQISVFQITKAIICIFGAIMRLAKTIFLICREKNDIQEVVRGYTIFGIILVILGSIIVFSFTQFTWNNADGSLKFNNPQQLLEAEYDTDKYFDQVGVYANLASKDGGPNVGMATEEWVRLVDINDFGGKTIVTHVVFGVGANRSLSVQNPPGSPANVSECYIKNGEFWDLPSSFDRCSIQNQPTVSAVIKLKFVKPTSHLLLGDIEYNSKVYLDDECNNVTIPATPLPRLTLRYFKLRETILSEGKHLVVPVSVTESKFYSMSHLQSVEETWITGFIGCKFTGKSQPTHNTDLSVPCL